MATLLALVTAECCSALTLLCIDNQHFFLQCNAAILLWHLMLRQIDKVIFHLKFILICTLILIFSLSFTWCPSCRQVSGPEFLNQPDIIFQLISQLWISTRTACCYWPQSVVYYWSEEQGPTAHYLPLNVGLILLHWIKVNVPPSGRGSSIRWGQHHNLFIFINTLFRWLKKIVNLTDMLGRGPCSPEQYFCLVRIPQRQLRNLCFTPCKISFEYLHQNISLNQKIWLYSVLDEKCVGCICIQCFWYIYLG